MPESQKLRWMEFESPWPFQPGKVRVIQPGQLRREDLSNRAWRNEKAQPYVFETQFERRMHFTISVEDDIPVSSPTGDAGAAAKAARQLTTSLHDYFSREHRSHAEA